MLEKGSVEACQVEQIIHSVTSSSSPVSSLWLRFSTSSEDAYHRQFIEITILLQAFIKKHSQNLHPNHYYLQVLLLKRILWRGNLHKNHFVTNLLDKQCTMYNSINSFFSGHQACVVSNDWTVGHRTGLFCLLSPQWSASPKVMNDGCEICIKSDCQWNLRATKSTTSAKRNFFISSASLWSCWR